MSNLRSNIVGWLGRKYFSRIQKSGFDLSKMSFLPSATLAPLRRNGLDPVDELARTRAKEPISKLPLPFGMKGWLVTGYDETKAVLGRVNGFSSDFTNLAEKNIGIAPQQNPGGLGFSDPPTHTRLRRLLTPEFTMRRLSRLTPRIHSIVEERLDEMAAMGAAGDPVDLVQSFALPIPSLVICELLGVPYEDREDFQQLSLARFDLFDGADTSFGAISDSLSYLLDIVKKQRESPGDGLLGMLVKEHGDKIDDQELAGLADGVLTGGFETTASMLALGTLVLLRNPEQFAEIRDNDDVVDRYVEELLRYLTVVQVAFPRFAKEDMEIAGTKISSGDLVLCSLSGANREEKLGPDMERFDPHRQTPSHLAFGHGIHRCIGAELAKMELRAAYPALVRRFPEMRLAVPQEKLAFRKLSIVYGVEALPVTLKK
ncbi:cytochrome P450 [Streptomyces sp. NBS 14/10]|uniref:cytochrome P450 n=1 Tax=Streptomyces sp. NBS 14/10 TaxID=1945643 RepID=UPI000B7CECF9|nr:cytochrome P450 [Streptomyces sp. NBS 14/10]KAK1180345.1 cytochrome P450 [Streptomyces sp. NBS 14/10]